MSYKSQVRAQQVGSASNGASNSFFSSSITCQISTMTIINVIGDIVLMWLLYNSYSMKEGDKMYESKNTIITALILGILIVTVLTVSGIICSFISIKDSSYINTAYYLQSPASILFALIVVCGVMSAMTKS